MIPATRACGRRHRRVLAPSIRRAARTPGADRYRKHFPATAHLWILLLHGLSAAPSLRQSYAMLTAVPGLFADLGLGQGISFSQLARSSTSRPSTCAEALLAEVVAQAQRAVVPDRSWRILRRVQIIDSTFLRLSAELSPWSQHRRFTPGVRVQTGYDLARQLPTTLRLHLVATNDHEALKTWELDALRGWTALVDLGYYGHRQFARLRAHGVAFLSRLHPQAVYQVTAVRAVSGTPTRDGDVVLSDETITLGSANNRAGAVLPGIRLIRSRNRAGRDQAFITDRFDLTASELVRLYRYRWRIELFFRFLKHQLGMTSPLGQSRAAVWLTVVLAAIIALVLALTDAERPVATSRIAWLRALGVTLQTLRRGG
ncbi:MAG: IS4 family transposase [Chloroflexia bacterium]|nr:IS4 family transposase [Chloroflexia bacterium]